MKDGPDISSIATMMGDRARANMLLALMSGMALTATELAREGDVTASTASGHLAKLEAAGLVVSVRRGRFRYFRIAAPDVAQAVEALVNVAGRLGHMRPRPGPRDAAMREARSCYDHLAGRLAVQLFEHWSVCGILAEDDGVTILTDAGRRGLSRSGLEIDALSLNKRPLCHICMDWSERRNHLAGAVGAAVLDRVLEQQWAERDGSSRVIRFSPRGEKAFVDWFARADSSGRNPLP